MANISVLNFVRTKAIFHSKMRYSRERKSFDLLPLADTAHGVYFILDGDDILKIGKADGKTGLSGSISTYRANLSSRKNDHTVNKFYKNMLGPLMGKELEMYIYPLPPKSIEHEGYTLEGQMTRSLERILSIQAKSENNSMLLSGQD